VKQTKFTGWICKIAVTEADKELGSLLDEKQYNDFLESQHDEEAMHEAQDKSK
jgi:glycine cleavage system H lipoate-binding protein